MIANQELLSIGSVCQLCSAMPPRVRDAAERIGERAALRLDHVDYFTPDSAERIRQALSEGT